MELAERQRGRGRRWNVRRRLRQVRGGLTALHALYNRDRNALRLVGRLWFTATRQGLVGVRLWLLEATLQPEPPPQPVMPPACPAPLPPPYLDWLERFDLLSAANLRAAKQHLAQLDLPDLLILVIATGDNVAWLDRAVEAWTDSIHQRWHAAILLPPQSSRTALASITALAVADGRICVLAGVDEVERVRRRFDYTLLCLDGVLLNPLSAYMFLEAAQRTGAEVVYSDHDQIGPGGRRHDPSFKPQFSPNYISHYNYVGDCLLISRDIELGDDDIAALLASSPLGYDRFVSRIMLGRTVEHLPFILFHVTADKQRSKHDLPEFPNSGPTVAIVIPTRDGLRHLEPCIASILKATAYDLTLVQIVVVDNDSSDPATLAYLERIAGRPRFTVLRHPEEFNFSVVNNIGARASASDILVFLNDDTTVNDPAWLSKLVWHAKQDTVGAVGAKLLFPDGTIQHGGCIAGGNMGTVQHLLGSSLFCEADDTGYTREITLVTGACLAMRRAAFEELGGFDPILRITWNDAKLCLASIASGLRNIYVSDPILTHDESRTRGKDDTREKYIRYFSEAHYTRRLFHRYFQDDPYFNPNLSVDPACQFAHPPRVRHPWFRLNGRPARILVLSRVYKVGYGVPLVIHQQASKLRELGYDVIIGGPLSENEFSFPGCERIELTSVAEAAAYAFTGGVALIISHTPPFFEIPILIGPHIPVLAYDYGEPSAEFFTEPTRSYLLEVGYQKRAAAALTTAIATISQAVKEESLNKEAVVLGLANSHMRSWTEALRPQRDQLRREFGWSNAFVILTVCRFHENERAYKGLDKVASVLREFPFLHPELSGDLVWVLAGAGTADDVLEAERLGFAVFANVSDERLADLYMAADAYMSFSKWEGYNLGISQALAMGLPTAASDIPAHREFPVFTSNSTLAICGWLAQEISASVAVSPARRAIIYDWDQSTARFAELVGQLLSQSAANPARCGASTMQQTVRQRATIDGCPS